jgi:hypothetical protein
MNMHATTAPNGTNVQPSLFADRPWIEVKDGDRSGLAIFHRHYSYKPYADGRKPKLFVAHPGGDGVMTHTAELRPSPTQAVTPPADDDERYRSALLAALRVAHAKAKLVILNIEDIGTELRDGRLTPMEAMRLCVIDRIDSLFPREGDGG